MKILLIGNGFDLEHGLPTSYMDFLDFCQRVERIYTLNPEVTPEIYERNNLEDWKGNVVLKENLRAAFESRKYQDRLPENAVDDREPVVGSNALFNEIHNCLRGNPWLKYFENVKKTMGRSWIDFEAEINRIVQQLDGLGAMTKPQINFRSFKYENDNINELSRKVYKKLNPGKPEEMVPVDQFAASLYSELERFIRALEVYIAGFVQEIAVERKSPDTEHLQPDRVLSFNYSNTYERVYGAGRDIVYDYIHGKADLNSNARTSQLVLGIQEYLSDDRKDQDLLFLPFKKYFQRIYKSTDNAYLSWAYQFQEEDARYRCNVQSFLAGEPVPQPKAPGRRHFFTDLASIPHTTHELYIFGHSLDVTDGDVLRRLICNDSVQTTIFYQHKDADDKSSLAKKIRNLVRVIGQDELIRRTGGPSQTIRFLPQT